MKSAVARQHSTQQPKKKLFEFGYERRSDNRSSIETVRAEFLSRILDTKVHIVFDLFASAYKPFTYVLEKSASEIEVISASVEAEIPEAAYIMRQPKFIRERALKLLVQDCNFLQKLEGADALCAALKSWARRNNLTDEWCLNHAVSFLRAWDREDGRRLAIALLPDPYCLIAAVKRCWQCASLDRHSEGLWSQFQSNAEVEKRGLFSFVFKNDDLEFSVTGPFSKSVASFKREVDHEFEAQGGRTIRGARKVLKYQLNCYLSRIEPLTTELGLEARHTRWATADHLNWLIQYQLPPCKTFREIARQVGRNEKTIREGIRGAAQLLGLTLRSAERDKHFGRPKGAKDRKPRHRVVRRRQKLREIPRDVFKNPALLNFSFEQ